MTWCGAIFSTDSPSMRTAPVVGLYTRVTTLKSVVLPAPLGPIKATTWPASTSKETRSKATTPPKRTLSSRTSRSDICAESLEGRDAGDYYSLGSGRSGGASGGPGGAAGGGAGHSDEGGSTGCGAVGGVGGQ